MKQEVNFTARGYLHLMMLQWTLLMKAQKLLKLTLANPDQDLEESTPCCVNLVKTCLTKRSHRLFRVRFLLVYRCRIAVTFMTLNGTSMVMNVSLLLLRALLESILTLRLHRWRVSAETVSSDLTRTSLTTWRARNLLRPNWDLTVHQSKDRSQGQRRGFHWTKFWQQETALAVLECSVLFPKLKRKKIFEKIVVKRSSCVC